MAVDVPNIVLEPADELWIRGWQPLVDPDATEPGREIILMLSAAQQE